MTAEDLAEVLRADLAKEAERLRMLARATSVTERQRLQKRFEREREHVRKLVQVLAPRACRLHTKTDAPETNGDEATTAKPTREALRRPTTGVRVACETTRTETVQDVEFHRYVCRKVAAAAPKPSALTAAALHAHKSRKDLLQEKHALLQQLHHVVVQQQRKLQDDEMTVRSAVSSFKSLALRPNPTYRYVPFATVSSTSVRIKR
ncbi:hypothetical protein ACHHYP_20854 [Achlya hypogyna]|uniref:Uncharacterized protein n=1 Tax=Achlya hypogyna TaxID=1202772 RepID=A0A1V9Y529_ACHHY|nr:hypothetical protein ACHHYP_20854 [Achlya hypogyna]